MNFSITYFTETVLFHKHFREPLSECYIHTLALLGATLQSHKAWPDQLLTGFQEVFQLNFPDLSLDKTSHAIILLKP